MDQECQGVHRLTVEEEYHLLYVRPLPMRVLVIERGIALRLRLELVEEVAN